MLPEEQIDLHLFSGGQFFLGPIWHSYGNGLFHFRSSSLQSQPCGPPQTSSFLPLWSTSSYPISRKLPHYLSQSTASQASLFPLAVEEEIDASCDLCAS